MAPIFRLFAIGALLSTAYATKTVTKTKEVTKTEYITSTKTHTVTQKCSTSASGPPAYPSQPAGPKSYWSGWAGISYLFVFGMIPIVNLTCVQDAD